MYIHDDNTGVLFKRHGFSLNYNYKTKRFDPEITPTNTDLKPAKRGKFTSPTTSEETTTRELQRERKLQQHLLNRSSAYAGPCHSNPVRSNNLVHHGQRLLHRTHIVAVKLSYFIYNNKLYCFAPLRNDNNFIFLFIFIFIQTKFCHYSFNISLPCERERKCSIISVHKSFAYFSIYSHISHYSKYPLNTHLSILAFVICYKVYSFVFTSPFTDHHFFVFLFHKKKFVPFF